jgi:hypothetical protein
VEQGILRSTCVEHAPVVVTCAGSGRASKPLQSVAPESTKDDR